MGQNESSEEISSQTLHTFHHRKEKAYETEIVGASSYAGMVLSFATVFVAEVWYHAAMTRQWYDVSSYVYNKAFRADLTTIEDHYDTVAGDDDLALTLDEISAKYENRVFNAKCIYGTEKGSSEVTNKITICSGCRKFIQDNANRFGGIA